MTMIPEQLFDLYVDVRESVISNGFGAEIDWQTGLRFAEINESDFLREAAWVILSAGMRETIIRQRFPALSNAFFNWQCADAIAANRSQCSEAAFEIFRHGPKIAAIVNLTENVASNGFLRIKRRLAEEGLAYLQTFDFIGPVTSFHLAKNLGINVAKPDRHLKRFADLFGFKTPQELCQMVSNQTGDSVAVVDLVFWRFATLNPGYQEWFRGRLGQA